MSSRVEEELRRERAEEETGPPLVVYMWADEGNVSAIHAGEKND